jgi:hypothetical protein
MPSCRPAPPIRFRIVIMLRNLDSIHANRLIRAAPATPPSGRRARRGPDAHGRCREEEWQVEQHELRLEPGDWGTGGQHHLFDHLPLAAAELTAREDEHANGIPGVDPHQTRELDCANVVRVVEPGAGRPCARSRAPPRSGGWRGAGATSRLRVRRLGMTAAQRRPGDALQAG